MASGSWDHIKAGNTKRLSSFSLISLPTTVAYKSATAVTTAPETLRRTESYYRPPDKSSGATAHRVYYTKEEPMDKTKTATYPHHESLRLVNFTAFADASFAFSPTVNIFVGENGTGKTHLMKVLYAVQYACSRKGRTNLLSPLFATFQCERLALLVRNEARHNTVGLSGNWNDEGWDFTVEYDADDRDWGYYSQPADLPTMPRPVFIPAIDMMAHTRRFLSTYDNYEIAFDQTHRDIVSLLLSPESRNPTGANTAQATLAPLLGGEVVEESEQFYLKTANGRQPMQLVAEGVRKIATLWQLLRNGFLRPGDTLFWDEPEANVNPKLRDEIVSALLALARSGVQIFLATHSYVILKEFDLQAEASDAVRYFALETTENGTVAHATEDYAELMPNPIAEQFDRLYDLELTRATGRKRRA